MSATERTYEQLLTDAIRVLTEAARQTRTLGTGQTTRQEPADFAEFLSLAVAGAAGNIGGIDRLLAGRPGSWEADFVYRLLIGTVGEDEAYLMEHRTEPVTVTVNVDDILADAGYWELYDDADAELFRREDAIDPDSADADAAYEEIETLRTRMDELRERDLATYGKAFKANVLAAAAELFPTLGVPVDVVVNLHHRQGDEDSTDELLFAGPAQVLCDQARADTPIPSSGMALKDYPLDMSMAHAEYRAGRSVLSRISVGQ